MSFRTRLLNFITPLIKWWGSKHLPFTHKLMTGIDYYECQHALKPGVIFLTRMRGEGSNLLIPGFWTHAAIYTPEPGKIMDEVITQATGQGVGPEDIISFLTSKDYVMAMEPAFLGEKKDQIMKRAAVIASEQTGKPYNYDMDFQVGSNHAFYCSELCWYAYDQACKEFGVVSPFVPRETWGEPTITPDDIAQATKKFTIVWKSRSSLDRVK